ncbi:MAG: hypothetical protein NZ853_07455 [Leptospiraceae bacterium]|nr:hypothetical protein [Leptospiraceae bacterium]MDW7975729.1 type II secretion system protein N [Leptospiraceae bacterium]
MLVYLYKNTFFLLLVGVIFLSFSLSYFVSVLLSYILSNQIQNQKLQKEAPRTSITLTLPSPRPYEEFDGVLSGNLFQLSTERQMATESAPVVTKDIELLGVLAGSPQFARALIKIKDENLIQEYAIGDTPGGNKIIKILSHSIVISQGARDIELGVGESLSSAKQEKPAQTEKQEKSSQNVQKITIPRSRIIQLTKNQTQLYENKFAPITKNGKILGMKAIFIPNHSILYELGARTGDIFRRINGQPINDVNKLLELWQNVQTLNKLTVEVERSGRIFSYEILIQD